MEKIRLKQVLHYQIFCSLGMSNIFEGEKNVQFYFICRTYYNILLRTVIN